MNVNLLSMIITTYVDSIKTDSSSHLNIAHATVLCFGEMMLRSYLNE